MIEIDGKKYVEVKEHYLIYCIDSGYYDADIVGDFVDFEEHPSIYDDIDDAQRDLESLYSEKYEYRKPIPREKLHIIPFDYVEYFPYEEIESKVLEIKRNQ